MSCELRAPSSEGCGRARARERAGERARDGLGLARLATVAHRVFILILILIKIRTTQEKLAFVKNKELFIYYFILFYFILFYLK